MKRAKYTITTNSPENSEWKHIVVDGDPINYEVNIRGIVRNIQKGNILKERITRKANTVYSYSQFNLLKNGKEIYLLKKRLLACIFVPVPDKYKYIDQLELETFFKNGDTTDYSIENIGWYYPLDIEASKEDLPLWRTLTKSQIDEAVEMLKSCEYSLEHISKITGIDKHCLSKLKSSKKGRPYNYITANTEFGKVPGCCYPEGDVIKVCELLSSTDYSINELTKITGLDYTFIYDIYHGISYPKLYNKYKWKKNKLDYGKLAKSKVREICELLQDGKLSYRKIGKIVGCSKHTVYKIHKRDRHTDISKDYKW